MRPTPLLSSPSHCQPGPTHQRMARPCSDSAARLRAPRPDRGQSGRRPSVRTRPHALPTPRGTLTIGHPPPLPPHRDPLKGCRPPTRPHPFFSCAPISLPLRPHHQHPHLSSVPHHSDCPPEAAKGSPKPLTVGECHPDGRAPPLTLAATSGELPPPSSCPMPSPYYAGGHRENLLRPQPETNPRQARHRPAPGMRTTHRRLGPADRWGCRARPVRLAVRPHRQCRPLAHEAKGHGPTPGPAPGFIFFFLSI
jgi:hypothetical protein